MGVAPETYKAAWQIAEKRIASLESRERKLREALEWQSISSFPKDATEKFMFWLDWADDCKPLNPPLVDDDIQRFVGYSRTWSSVYKAIAWRRLPDGPALADPQGDGKEKSK